MEKIIAVSLLSVAFCLGSSPVPFPGERYEIDQIYKVVGEPALRAEAVGLLTAIAACECTTKASARLQRYSNPGSAPSVCDRHRIQTVPGWHAGSKPSLFSKNKTVENLS
jgi:hypothetical protein